MTLSFPNPSRSLDTSRDCICFWGYDETIEVSFFLEVSALRKLFPKLTDTADGFLEAFDRASKKIHKAAAKAYANGRRRSHAYNLSVGDF